MKKLVRGTLEWQRSGFKGSGWRKQQSKVEEEYERHIGYSREKEMERNRRGVWQGDSNKEKCVWKYLMEACYYDSLWKEY